MTKTKSPRVLNYQDILKREFHLRLQKNQLYSLRAFARDLELSAPRLSEIMNAKTGLSRKAAEEIADRLQLSPIEKNFFCDSVESQFARKAMDRERAALRLRKQSSQQRFQIVNLDSFHLIADWYHFAILEMMELKNFKNDHRWIADSLGLLEWQVSEAIERLKRVDLVHEIGGVLRPKSELTSTPSGHPSEAIRLFHSQVLMKALKALEEQSVEKRDFSGMVMSLDASEIDQVKQKIKKFRRSLVRDLSQSEKKNAVYCLSIQFFDILKGNMG